MAPLPESQREILVMLKVNGLSIEGVARVTSSTVASVKQKVHRAYNRLRALLPKKRAWGRWYRRGPVTCREVESLIALYAMGAAIPRSAAAHIAACERCRSLVSALS